MRIHIWHVPLFILLIALLHFVALYTGLYDYQIRTGIVWWDNILHALVGATFGAGWLWIIDRVRWELSPAARILSTLLIVGALAVLWELAEYVLLVLHPETAYSLLIYSLSIGEAIMDSLSNLLGAAALLWLAKATRKENAEEESTRIPNS